MTEVRLQNFFSPFLIGKDDAAEATTLTVDVLGRRIDDDMRAQFQWLLEEGGRKDVIHDQLGTDLIGNICDSGNVDDFQRRVRRAFKQHYLGVGTDGGFPVLDIRAIDYGNFHAISWQ